jgi:hypothetical protein
VGDTAESMGHVGLCKHLRHHQRQMTQNVKALSKLPDEPIAASVRDGLLQPFHDRGYELLVPFFLQKSYIEDRW